MRIAQFVGPTLSLLVSACVAATPAPSNGPPAVSSTVSPAVSATSETTPRTAPSVTAAPTVEPQASDEAPEPETTPDPRSPIPTMPPAPGWPHLAGIMSEWQGGCGAVAYRTEIIAADACGPFLFDPLLESDPVRVNPGARLVLRAPAGSTFSLVTAGIDGEWSVKLARAPELRGLDDVETGGFPHGIGTVLAHGRGPDSSVIVTMPADAGLYVVQYDGPIVVGDWSFLEGVYFWLVRVL